MENESTQPNIFDMSKPENAHNTLLMFWWLIYQHEGHKVDISLEDLNQHILDSKITIHYTFNYTNGVLYLQAE